jgi:hypothetical protein
MILLDAEFDQYGFRRMLASARLIILYAGYLSDYRIKNRIFEPIPRPSIVRGGPRAPLPASTSTWAIRACHVIRRLNWKPPEGGWISKRVGERGLI